MFQIMMRHNNIEFNIKQHEKFKYSEFHQIIFGRAKFRLNVTSKMIDVS